MSFLEVLLIGFLIITGAGLTLIVWLIFTVRKLTEKVLPPVLVKKPSAKNPHHKPRVIAKSDEIEARMEEEAKKKLGWDGLPDKTVVGHDGA